MQRIALLVMAGILSPVFARAEAPPVDAKKLGTTEALYSYCSRANPSTADNYRRQIAKLTQGVSAQTLVAVRRSDEYRKAQSAVKDFVQKIDPHNNKKICTESALSNSGHADSKN